MRSAIAVMCLPAGVQAFACDLRMFVSRSARPLPADVFSGITRHTLVETILEKLGPAARDVGSGLHVLEWDVADGRVFSVSAASCGKPYNVAFRERAANKPVQPIVE